MGDETTIQAPPPAGDDAVPARACQNCGTPLLGEHCYRCGQPVKGLVRHFTSILGDFFDSVFDFDGRTPRTLWPLFAKPGYLSCEYFEGRRVRFVSPLRLFFFLSIVTFFVAQLAIQFDDGITVNTNDNIGNATTVAEVERQRDEALAGLEVDPDEVADVPGADAGISAGAAAIRARADERIAELEAAEARGEPPPKPDSNIVLFGDEPWDVQTNPIAVTWLPGFVNDWLNGLAGRTERNIARLQDDPSLFKDALLGAIPSTLFVLLPLFALMLKVAYLFKRRLYMEHLIVALHSHAFLCLTLLLVFLVIAVRDWLAPDAGVLRGALGWIETGLFVWMPLYLLLMQKRVYRQGWPMTLLKYCVLGFCYFMLLSFGAVFTVLASLVWM